MPSTPQQHAPQRRPGAVAVPDGTDPAGALDPAHAEVVDAVLAACAGLEGPLLPILHGIQDRLGHVPPAALPRIARALHLSRAEVHGVVSYYHHFRSRPPGRRVVQVCRAEACRSMGAEALLAQARQTLGCSEAEPTSACGGHTVEAAYCLGLCAMSPALVIDGQPHARMTPQRLDTLLAVAPAAEGAPA
ncbi:formate dehydrogenase gamma subunit [Sphaerotilus hippei]|uniref:Formate dehydrogenase gamma subunit n=1 Tax=Sphaerotilus hippei TaxID=744406 RepID=A0A318GX23_9BURK|nr:formate dehydrogenase subunit gamma [Sphaerotilus hippei]PXW93682.1 formate dehydrogenase gamma subunit [Sphaerotilus hippei]